ncbi:MAG: flagellin, partial [Oscillospiraceae bacterium]
AQSATLTFKGGADATTAATNALAQMEKVFGSGYTVANANGTLTITAKTAGADKTKLISATQANGTAAATDLKLGATTAGKDATYSVTGATTFTDVATNNALEIDGQKYQIVTRGGAVQAGSKALYIDQTTGALSADSAAQIAKQLQAYGVKAEAAAGTANITISKATAGSKSTGGLVLQIGETADAFNKLTVGISDVHASALGVSGVNIGTQQGASDGLANLKAAINSVSSTRGDLGAIQNRLDHTINNLNVMTENIQEAESSIRDVDVADEMMAYTKNNILVQSAQAMLAQANQLPQGVLQLLQ